MKTHDARERMRWTAPLLLVIGVLTFLVALATGPLDAARIVLAVAGVALAGWGMFEWERSPRSS